MRWLITDWNHLIQCTSFKSGYPIAAMSPSCVKKLDFCWALGYLPQLKSINLIIKLKNKHKICNQITTALFSLLTEKFPLFCQLRNDWWWGLEATCTTDVLSMFLLLLLYTDYQHIPSGFAAKYHKLHYSWKLNTLENNTTLRCQYFRGARNRLHSINTLVC